MHHDSDRFRQIADPFSQKSRFWTLFPQWVCSLAATPPRLVAPPPANGGMTPSKAPTRRRHAVRGLRMAQNPHRSHPEVHRIAYKTWTQHRLARQRGDIETNNTTAHPQQGTAETGITTATEKCTKNARFSHAKAMTVSIPHRHTRAKATPVSNNRAAWSTGPGRGARVGFEARCRRDWLAWPRRPWAAAGPGRVSSRRAQPCTATQRRRCGGRRRDRRARAGFEARRRTK